MRLLRGRAGHGRGPRIHLDSEWSNHPRLLSVLQSIPTCKGSFLKISRASSLVTSSRIDGKFSLTILHFFFDTRKVFVRDLTQLGCLYRSRNHLIAGPTPKWISGKDDGCLDKCAAEWRKIGRASSWSGVWISMASIFSDSTVVSINCR